MCPAGWLSRLVAVVLAVAVLASPAAASEPAGDGVRPGDRIRYVLPGSVSRMEAVVLQRSTDESGASGWLVRPPEGEPIWLSETGLRQLDIFRETGPLVKRGCLIGLVIGAVVAPMAVAFAIGYPDAYPWFLLYLGPSMGAAGSGLGALIGLSLRPERWDTVIAPRPPARVSITPVRGLGGRGVGLGLTVAF
jgi:hypothetical protein